MRNEHFQQARVLIIDDEIAHVDFLTTILGNEGYSQIKGVTDPRTAVAEFEKFRPDIVVLDLSMPEVSGLQVLKQLRAIIPGDAYLPIIVVTAVFSTESRQEALATGANDFVVKPYDASEIVLRIANLVETRFFSLQTRERGQEELHQSEERFRLMFEKSGVGMVLTTTNGILLQVNAAFCTLIARNEKEIVGHVATEFTHPDDIEKTVSPLVEMREDGVHVIDQEKRYLRKDGAIVWAHVTAVLHFDEKAEPLYFIAMVEDITARKQAEDALRANEKHFRTMFEKTPVGMSVVSPGLCWLQVNPALCDFLGYSEAELTGRPITDFTHPADIEKTLTELSAAEAQGPHVFHLEKRYVRQDGAVIWGEVSAVLHFDEGGKPLHLLGVVQDITDRKRAENALWLAKEEWAQSFDGIPDLICVLDMSGKILRANQTMRDRFEPAHGNLIGLDYRICYCGTAQLENQSPCAEVLAKGQPMMWEGEVPAIDGWFWIASYPLFDADGKQWGAVSVVRDISARKEAEEALREAQEELEDRVRARTAELALANTALSNAGMVQKRVQEALAKSESCFRALYDENPLMLLTVDAGGLIRSISRFGAQQLGYAPEELIGKPLAILYQKEDQEAAANYLAKCFNSSPPQQPTELRKVRKDGSLLWTRETIRTLGSHGDGLAIVVCEDITQRKQTKEALHESEERFRQMAEA